MTPARFKSCGRLLRGITIQAEVNRHKLHMIVANRDRLKRELERLARLIGEERFADRKLLSAMSRRIGHTSIELNNTEKELAMAHKQDLRLERAKSILTQRIRKHEIENEDQRLVDLTSASISFNRGGQCATRKSS
jgi:hypothetical protein